MCMTIRTYWLQISEVKSVEKEIRVSYRQKFGNETILIRKHNIDLINQLWAPLSKLAAIRSTKFQIS